MFKRIMNTKIQGLKLWEIGKAITLMATFGAISLGATIWLLLPGFFLWVKPEDDSVFWFIIFATLIGTLLCGGIYSFLEQLYIDCKKEQHRTAQRRKASHR